VANPQTQAIVMKDFSGGIWLNEGEAPDNTYSSFIENLDLLRGGGVQKRAPVRLNYKVLSGSNKEALIFSSYLQGPMVQWMQADPTNGLRYVVLDWYADSAANAKMKCFDRTTSTIVWTAAVSHTPGVGSFDFGSSDAGAFWYLHTGDNTTSGVTYKVTPAGTVTGIGGAFNENLAAPTNGNMPVAHLGTQHLAYYFVGHTYEGGSPTEFKNRIRWSHPGRFEDYRSNDKQDVGDASRVIGLYSVNETLLIVKETSLWVMTGYDPDTFQFRKIADLTDTAVDSTSTVSRLAGCSQTQTGAFVYVQGAAVYHWDGRKLEDISAGIKDALVDGRVDVRHMAVIGNTLYMSSGVSFGSGTPDAQTDKSWQYDLETKAWTQHNASFVALAPIQATVAGNPKAYAVHQHGKVASVNAGYSFSFYQQRVAAGSWCDNQYGSDSDIVCTYRTPWQDARNPARKKRWTRPWIVSNKRPNASASDPTTYAVTVYRNWDGVHASKTGTITAVKATDTTDYSTNFGYGHASTGSDFDEGLKLPSLGSSYSVQLKIDSVGTPKDQWGFDSLTFKFVPRILR
jgi:hypothetical protein